MARINFLRRSIVTVLIFGCGMAAAVLLAWTYTKPLSQVVSVARRVAQGHLEERLPVDRQDEIGDLNRSFNEMVERLQERSELEARLRRAERMSAVAHLASGIAHEVRNPLNLINLTMDHMRARFAPSAPEPKAEFTRLSDLVKNEVRRLNVMIEAFLRYGRPLKLTRQPTELRRVIEEVLAVAAQKADAENVRIERDLPEALPDVWVDVSHLKTCFLNLTLNAFQAMPGGGVLVVAARAVQLPDANPSFPQGCALVRFQDTGTGIAAEDLPRVFEPYFTTKEVGIGLGLALTKQIVEEHGGQIAITSTPGQGTQVEVRLPLGVPA